MDLKILILTLAEDVEEIAKVEDVGEMDKPSLKVKETVKEIRIVFHKVDEAEEKVVKVEVSEMIR